jgi:hypothetical protein
LGAALFSELCLFTAEIGQQIWHKPLDPMVTLSMNLSRGCGRVLRSFSYESLLPMQRAAFRWLGHFEVEKLDCVAASGVRRSVAVLISKAQTK